MKEKINANQFFILFFINSTYYVSTISGNALNDNFTDSIISAFVSALLGFLLALPVLSLREKGKLGQIKPALGVFYVIYFVISDIFIISTMQNLMTSTILPEVPPILIGLMAVAVAVYGAVKGIEVVARAGLLIFVIMIIGVITIYVGLIPLWNNHNLQIPFESGFSDSIVNSFEIFARSSFLPQSVILLTAVKGQLKKKAFFWNLGVALLASSAFGFIIFCLGGFSSTQLFPVYTLSSISQLMPIQRLDIIFSVVWLTMLTVRLSCDFIAIKECVGKKFKSGALVLSIAGAVILLLSAVCNYPGIKNYVLSGIVYLGIPAVILGTIVPIIIRKKANR